MPTDIPMALTDIPMAPTDIPVAPFAQVVAGTAKILNIVGDMTSVSYCSLRIRISAKYFVTIAKFTAKIDQIS